MLESEKGEVGFVQLLHQRIEQSRDNIAVEHGDTKITFWKLHCTALRLAKILRDLDIRPEEPIAILSPRGLNHILSQIAVLYAGGSCVPLDVDLDDEEVNRLLLNLGAKIMLVDSQNTSRLPHIHHVVVNHVSIQTDTDVNHTPVYNSGRTYCSHILHTSGSTGQPKAVQVLARGLMNLVCNQFAPVVKGHRVAHVCNTGFDVSLWEMWSPLMNRATIVIFDQHEILDPLIFERRLKHSHIDVMWQTTSLLATIAHTCPHAYSHVDTLLTGGEAINLHTIKTITENGPPRRLLNVYGPTELTVFATYHEVTTEDIEEGHIPIGRPLGNYQAHVVDENYQPVPNGSIGELLVGGAGVTGGYLNQPEKTAKAFIHAPNLCDHHEGASGLYYRTGDLVSMNSAGILYYHGRCDGEVKIRGRRVELRSIEEYLLKTELISSAVALRVILEEEGAGSILLGCVTPASDSVSVASIREKYLQLAPHLMIPRIWLRESLPLTGSGKIDRRRLTTEYIDQLRSLRSISSQSQDNDAGYMEDKLCLLWQGLLGIPIEDIQACDDFFLLGGTSLEAALLVSKIRQSLDLAIPVATLFQNSTLQDMSIALSVQQKTGAMNQSATEMTMWLRDCQLGKDLPPVKDLPTGWTIEEEGKIFLTGATGFIGAFLLAHLVTLPHVKEVACLVRAEDSAHGLVRIRLSFRQYGISVDPDNEAKILALPGDIGQEYLGIGPQQYSYFSEWASVVFHLGAHINFIQPYSSHRTANILGTLNMIRFAISGRVKALHYTSSISAYGPTGMVTECTHLRESERPASHIEALVYDTGYAQSQLVAETIAWNAIDKGIHIAIHRLGLVMGHSQTAAMNLDDFFSRVIKSSIQTGCYPLLPRHREDLVPVDFVVSSLIHIASDPANLGQAYNLLHPDATSKIHLPMIFGIINASAEYQLQGIAFSDWVRGLVETPDHYLGSMMPALEEKVFGNWTRWEMHQNMPEFSRDNTLRALIDAPELLDCPDLSTLVARYVPRWVQSVLPSEN